MGKAKGESRGLAYLQQVRPEAVSHLLRFFRESGQHLEPRTRFLISIVTKVINLSPRGLQQYVRRALVLLLGPHILILSGHVGLAGLRLIGCRMSVFPAMWPCANVLELL